MSDVVRLDDVRRKREGKPARFNESEASRLVAAGYKYTAMGLVEDVSRTTTDEGDESIAIIGHGGRLILCIGKLRDGTYYVCNQDLQKVVETRSLDMVLKLLGVT